MQRAPPQQLQVTRHEQAEVLAVCRAQAHSAAAKRDRQRRQYLVEGSFADTANNHGFKRARWRRLWRQQVQDYLIAAIQNTRILLARVVLRPAASAAVAVWRCRLGLTRLVSLSASTFQRLSCGRIDRPGLKSFQQEVQLGQRLQNQLWATRPQDAPRPGGAARASLTGAQG